MDDSSPLTTADAQQQYPYQQHSSPAGPSTSRIETAQYLPRQVFSSPTENLYPASTMAAVEATRKRFFAQQQHSAPPPRSRPTPFGTTSVSTRIRTHKTHAQTSSTYRQSFFQRCQRAMSHSRSAREERVTAFRKGSHAFTRGVMSDDMDEDDSVGLPSSPPEHDGQADSEDEDEGQREEDDELTRRRIIAEYSRLKRIYELKGQLEIGWIDPDQLSWLEEHSRENEEVVDPYWEVADEQLESLWLDSQTQHQERTSTAADVEMQEDEFGDDADFEEALASLPV